MKRIILLAIQTPTLKSLKLFNNLQVSSLCPGLLYPKPISIHTSLHSKCAAWQPLHSKIPRVHVEPGDVVVGDQAGVVCIPKAPVSQALEMALKGCKLSWVSSSQWGLPRYCTHHDGCNRLVEV